mmetsp:Transcript_30759/g.79875  ORF Transcript_30759/g.79875 Transcript_30759/m.79875 type:complete len:179 (-) Transcript_30759:70-606(-)
MGRSSNGLGRKCGKKRNTVKTPGILTEGTTTHDAAAARRDAQALLKLSSQSPAGAAALKRSSPGTSKASVSKYFRDKTARLEAELEDSNNLRRKANAAQRAAEEREERAKALAAQRLKDRNAARESERAWREDLHQAEDEMAGLAEHGVLTSKGATCEWPHGIRDTVRTGLSYCVVCI